mmetsp:Transcript_20776/g.45384  ORF Transcript_20776/g.45384 Transcript_20776/m.45384 type:complete len:102 (+) Transcript_20776:121-426(+)
MDYTLPSLLPAAVEPVWCPDVGMEEEDDLCQEERIFQQKLNDIRKQPAPVPIGVRPNKRDDDEVELVEDEEEEDVEDDMDDMEDSGVSIDEDEEDMGSDSW